MLATGTTVKSPHNPFRNAAAATPGLVNGGSAAAHTDTDLDIRPASLERTPSPGAAQSRSPSPELPPAHTSPQNVFATSLSNESSTSSPPQQTYDPPPGPPPGSSLNEAIVETIAEELPPAYTPTADVYQGETTIEFGPRRPFQSTSTRARSYAPWQRTQRSARPLSSAYATSNPNPSAGWAGYPGTAPVRRQPPGPPLIQVDPPPQHPALPGRNGGGAAVPSLPPRPVSEFARDFYAAGAGGSVPTGGLGVPNGGPASERPVTPPRPSQSGSGSQDGVPDDGRPTAKPVPGHPLLNSGKVLVYPAGYECPKCHNTGYKQFDPSHPCTKCWSKYAKVYAGPLTYTPWKPESAPSTESHAGTNLQRPLPASLTSHRHSQSLTDLGLPPPHPDVNRASSTSRPYRAYSGASASASASASPYAQAPRSGPGSWPPASWTDPQPRAQLVRGAPPGATVVRPGDPRIGGILCWRCGGSGLTSLFLFDEQTCSVCNGLGRTF